MTLDEAIKHAEEVAKEKESDLRVYEGINEDRPLFKEEENECRKCAKEHRQLAEWLKELKQLREQTRGVPVSERPPENGKEVLIYIDQSPYLATYEDGEWDTECFTVDPEYEPKTWFELPEPISEDDNENFD